MASKDVLLDTNGWIALLNTRDSLHGHAREVWRDLGRQTYRAVVTDWIIAEMGNGLARTTSRNEVRGAIERVFASPFAVVEFVDQRLLFEACELYQRRADKDWGLVDCASFLVMQRHGIELAFTNDHHFQQAGFRCLLRTN
jgi:uncharacterized protein